MAVYQLETTLTQDGVLTMNTLPFASGAKVKVTVCDVEEERDIDAETKEYYLSMTDEEKEEEDKWIRVSSRSAIRTWDEQ